MNFLEGKKSFFNFLAFFIFLISFLFGCNYYYLKKNFLAQVNLNNNLTLENQKLISEIKELQKEIKELQIDLEKRKEKEKKAREEIEFLKKSLEETKKQIRLLGISPKRKGKIYLPILVYHHIAEVSSNDLGRKETLAISPQTFEKQMEYILKENYHPITFKELFDYFYQGKNLPQKPVIITFDDGWLSQYKNAFPVLKRYNFKAVFFLVTNYIGGKSFMDWEQIRELARNGMEIGSHSVSHPNLTKISEKAMEYEINQSKIILERKLNVKIKTFAYPYGDYNSKVINTLRKIQYLGGRTIVTSLQYAKWQKLEDLYTFRGFQVQNEIEEFKKILPPQE